MNKRHLLGLSGGKDSSALAVYMKGKVSNMEYFFCDTGKELPEVYEFLDKLERFLEQPIIQLNASADPNELNSFDHKLKTLGGFLPNTNVRWCTIDLKIKPFERYVDGDPAYNYIAIRADEAHRTGYKLQMASKSTRIEPVYPFQQDGIEKKHVLRILDEAGVGVPDYYKWRTRSGCYFCFFQRKAEWIGLLENHPDLFQKAMDYEKLDQESADFTWGKEPLSTFLDPEKVEQIKRKLQREKEQKEYEIELRNSNPYGLDILEEVLDDEDDDEGCAICHK